MYKIYAAALAERLRKEVEEKGILPDSQDRQDSEEEWIL
jgi:hypothetical protein